MSCLSARSKLIDRCLCFLHRRANIFFNLTSPSPGTFVIGLHYKGRDKAILEMDLGLDDLLEKVRFPLPLPIGFLLFLPPRSIG
jgi:hypothetical protein